MARRGRGGARWRESDSLWGGGAETEANTRHTPPPRARALAHARSARRRAGPFPEQATSAALAGGGAPSAPGPARRRQATPHPEPRSGCWNGACWERSGDELRSGGCSKARLGCFKNGGGGLGFSRIW